MANHGKAGFEDPGDEMRKIWSYAAVWKDRYARRFDGMNGAEQRRAEAAEKFEIDRANLRRILIFHGADRERWQATGQHHAGRRVPGRLGGVGARQPKEMVDRSSGGSEYDAKSIVQTLKNNGWTPGQPIALVACTVGQEMNGLGQQVATLAKSPVFASISSTLRTGGYPLMAPYGWSYFEPK